MHSGGGRRELPGEPSTCPVSLTAQPATPERQAKLPVLHQPENSDHDVTRTKIGPKEVEGPADGLEVTELSGAVARADTSWVPESQPEHPLGDAVRLILFWSRFSIRFRTRVTNWWQNCGWNPQSNLWRGRGRTQLY